LKNRESGAPGVKIGNIYMMAGVPSIAARMLQALDGQLQGGRPVVSLTVGAYAPESEVAELLRATEEAHAGVAIGSYPFFKDGRYGANFVMRSDDGELVERTAEDLAERLSEAGIEPFPRRHLGLIAAFLLQAGFQVRGRSETCRTTKTARRSS